MTDRPLVTTQDSVDVLNAFSHLGHTDWRVAPYSASVFYGGGFITPKEARRIARAYLRGEQP